MISDKMKGKTLCYFLNCSKQSVGEADIMGSWQVFCEIHLNIVKEDGYTIRKFEEDP